MKLESSAFEHEGRIPERYTCDGQNINPPLTISDVPGGTVGLALIMDDPDLPPDILDGRFTHWLVWNIPPETDHIPEGGIFPGVQGKNSADKIGYAGCCPPKEHRYFFKLYALDANLNLDPDSATQDELGSVMEGHILEETELMGRYERPS